MLNHRMRATILPLLMLFGCGSTPLANHPLALTSPAPATAVDTVETVCGVSVTLRAGQVLNSGTGAAIPNGNYTSGGFYTQQGFYIPPCNYSVLDGQICQQGTPCSHGGW